MKPTAFCPAIGLNKATLRTICGMVLASALVLTPATVFGQRGAAGAHAGGARAGGGARAPQATGARPSTPIASRPATPIITRGPIVTRPAGVLPVSPFRGSVAPFHTPVTSGVLFTPRPPRLPIRPIVPLLGTAGVFGLAHNPFLFPGCNPFLGFVYGCGILAPYFGYGAYPLGVYPPGMYPTAYPGPSYPPDPVYSPSDTSASAEPNASLQYTPLLNEYPPASTLPPEGLSASSGATGQQRNEILIYLKDGSVFAVLNYTVSDGELRYVTAYGEKNDVAVDLLDLQKTIEANAQRGVAFTLTPSATLATPGAAKPTPLGPAPAPEGPITPAKQ